MSAAASTEEHPIFGAFADAAAVLSTMGTAAEHPLWTLTDRDLPAAVGSLLELAAKVQSVLIDVIGEVDSRGVATATGASSTGAWLRARHRLGGPEAYKLVKTASAFRAGLPATQAALAAGEIHAEHAHVIARAAAELPDDLHPAVAQVAEEALLADAHENDPVTCRRLSR